MEETRISNTVKGGIGATILAIIAGITAFTGQLQPIIELISGKTNSSEVSTSTASVIDNSIKADVKANTTNGDSNQTINFNK